MVNTNKGVKGMTGFMSLISLIAFVAIFVYIFKWIKHRRNKTLKKRYRNSFLISLAVMIFAIMMLGTGNSSSTSSKDTSKVATPTVKVVKKKQYVGKDKYDIAKKENVALLAKEKKLQKQADELTDQKNTIESDEAKAKQEAKEQQEQQAKAQAEAEKQQQAQAAAEQKQAAADQKQQAQQSQSSTQRGDMNTGNAGQIVGNTNSHIYHVPGQAGYNMNSSNAVYFNSEQDAINAGYRRSKR